MMLPEQEQRILGYFIEEAKDHLTTIEQGLLNLHNTLEDSEMVNAVFRAAHSIKGGAAMLGLDSIQQTSHRLEDYFKVFRECPTLPVDQKLETLFLRVFDTLQELVLHLESTLSLPEDVTSGLMSEVEPVFEELKQHLELLVKQAVGGTRPDPMFASAKPEAAPPMPSSAVAQTPQPAVPASEPIPATPVVKAAPAQETTSLLPVFQNDVMQKLREMLQLFKQSETPQSRQQLQDYCQQLARWGERFNLPVWSSLCKTSVMAIANGANPYRVLAPIVIKELKQSQELVLAGRGSQISISAQLQALSGKLLTKPEEAPSAGRGVSLTNSQP